MSCLHQVITVFSEAPSLPDWSPQIHTLQLCLPKKPNNQINKQTNQPRAGTVAGAPFCVHLNGHSASTHAGVVSVCAKRCALKWCPWFREELRAGAVPSWKHRKGKSGFGRRGGEAVTIWTQAQCHHLALWAENICWPSVFITVICSLSGEILINSVEQYLRNSSFVSYDRF